MSYLRRAKKVDSSQGEIVSALRQAGITVWILGQPCDLLTFYKGRWLPLECKPAPEPGIRVKTRATRIRTDQEHQQAFCRDFAVPIVRTAEDALEAVRTYGARAFAEAVTGVKP